MNQMENNDYPNFYYTEGHLWKSWNLVNLVTNGLKNHYQVDILTQQFLWDAIVVIGREFLQFLSQKKCHYNQNTRYKPDNQFFKLIINFLFGIHK